MRSCLDCGDLSLLLCLASASSAVEKSLTAEDAEDAEIRRGSFVVFELIEKSLLDTGVGIDAPVAQEGPVAAHFFNASEIHFCNQDLLAIGTRLCDYDAEGIGDER